MNKPLFGEEIELAFAVFDKRGQRLCSSSYCERLIRQARKLPSLPSCEGRGLFLANGARLYIDVGHHPEITTPEVTNPWDACRYVLAAREIMRDCAEQLLQNDRDATSLFLSVGNISYGPARTTWGCHESYAHRCETEELAQLLVPHLVSRVIYTGAGGFNNRSSGIEFLLSPRAAHITSITSASSQHCRGMIQAKDESLSNSCYHRLHLLVGESLMSQTAIWLKLGTTALIVSMVDAGLLRSVSRPRHPVAALHAFASDPTCTVQVPVVGGGRKSAIDIQREYLEQAMEHCGHPEMPPWTEELCRQWNRILLLLSEGPQAVERTLDWAIKLAIYRKFVEQYSIPWELLPKCNHAIELLQHAMEPDEHRVALCLVLQPKDVARCRNSSYYARAVSALKEIGLTENHLITLLHLRNQLWELDTKFAQIYPPGIFLRMEQAGLLEHAIVRREDVEHAKQYPPTDTRAAIRGKWVRELNATHAANCSWTTVCNFQEQWFLDLSDPFETREKRRPIDQRGQDELGLAGLLRATDRAERSLAALLQEAMRVYLQGKLTEAERYLNALRGLRPTGMPHVRELRINAWIAARRGYNAPEMFLDMIRDRYSNSLQLAMDYVFVHRFRYLQPAAEAWRWLRRASELAILEEHPSPVALAALHEHRGYMEMSAGHLEEAHRELRLVFSVEGVPSSHWIIARALAVRGELLRRKGQWSAASDVLAQALNIQHENEYTADLVDFTLPALAKLRYQLGEIDEAKALLKTALQHQVSGGMRVGQARTLLLMSRMKPVRQEQLSHLRSQLDQLREATPSLQQCPKFNYMMSHWQQWTQSDELDHFGDYFWGI